MCGHIRSRTFVFSSINFPLLRLVNTTSPRRLDVNGKITDELRTQVTRKKDMLLTNLFYGGCERMLNNDSGTTSTRKKTNTEKFKKQRKRERERERERFNLRKE